MIMRHIKETAWIGKDYVAGRVKGVVLVFHGLGGGLKNGPSTEELEWARAGGAGCSPVLRSLVLDEPTSAKHDR